MIPNLLGNIANWKIISKIAKKYKLKVIEDSADTIGYFFDKGNTGTYSDIVTNSFYASHIINGAGTGGIVCFNDYKLYEREWSWLGDLQLHLMVREYRKKFNIKISGIEYDAKYVFSELGYNFIPSEISAAFALEQLKKLKENIKIRNRNFSKLISFFSNYNNLFKLQNVSRC